VARAFDRPAAGNLSSPAQIVRYFDKFLTALEGNLGALAEAEAANANAIAALAAAAAAAHTADWSGVANDNGHKAADDATVGADWTANVASRPTELTDGRVSAGLNSSGDLNRDITSGRSNSSNLLRRTGGGLYTGALAATAGATLGTDVSGTIKPSNVSSLVDPLTVATAYIAANAVTNPTSAYSTGSTSIPNTSTWTDLQSVTITATGAPIIVHGFFYAGSLEYPGAAGNATIAQYQVLRDSTVIFGPVPMAASVVTGDVTGTGPNSALIIDQPASGSRTYKIQGISNSGGIITPTFRGLVIMEAKK
jgi:hypothetical protein